MNSQDIAEDVKCDGFYLTLGNDSHLLYESIAPMHNGVICNDFLITFVHI